ncbi:MAG: 50S ribosomal protein L25 [Candidatus Cloacimonetes bacterium]|nr:50S ribosomal protein L25 [Candidatus Cloacimonadota bacterium]HNZ06321.1 50S ribosomal protein L25 [Candidatus Cloacimonadota bacterium]
MIFTLEAQTRKTVRKSDLTKLRAQGMIPAVLYGPNMDSLSISIDQAEFTRCYKKSFNELAFYELQLAGVKYHTILKDKLVHPVGRHILHIDFMVVPATAQMEFEVPIHFNGEAVGTHEGGFVDVVHRTVKLVCQADVVPEGLDLDISNLRVGESLHVSDLPKGPWTIKDHEEVTLVVIHAKKAEAVAEPKAEPAAKPAEEK